MHTPLIAGNTSEDWAIFFCVCVIISLFAGLVVRKHRHNHRLATRINVPLSLISGCAGPIVGLVLSLLWYAMNRNDAEPIDLWNEASAITIGATVIGLIVAAVMLVVVDFDGTPRKL